MKRLLAIVVGLLCAGIAAAQNPQTGIIDPNRSIDWSVTNPGVVGGIPSATWTQCGSTVTAGTSAATIMSLWNACAAHTYLLLGPGTFNLNNSVADCGSNSNVALRGSGANSTFLVFSGETSCNGGYASIPISSADNNYSGAPSNTANWTAGYARGATTITLSSVSNLKVGWPIILDQQDDSANPTVVYPLNDIFVCAENQNVCTVNGDNGDGHRPGAGGTIRGQQQNVIVTSCDGTFTFGHACSSGVNITITPGLYMSNWCKDGGACPNTLPGAWWPTSPVFNVGVENLSIDSSFQHDQASVAIFINNCAGCWVSGIRSIKPGRSHVQTNYSPHTQVQNSYFWQTFNQSSVSYGMDMNNSSDSLVLNNIFEAITASSDQNGNCSGCVIAYNYTVNQWFTNPPCCSMLSAMNLHSEGNDTALYEGNNLNAFDGDSVHGTHNMVTYFRNAVDGYEQNGGSLPNNSVTGMVVQSFNRFFNVIGNVFGNSYSAVYDYTTNGTPAIQSFSGSSDSLLPVDQFTATSALLWGNWDAWHNAVLFCGNSSDTGWSTTCGAISASITSPGCTESGTTVTCTSTLNPPVTAVTGIASTFKTNITGNTVYNGSWTATVTSGTSFQFVAPAGMGTGTGGTATYGSQVPTAIVNYPNPVPTLGDTVAGQSPMPPSFLYRTKPSWWPSGKPWPPMGPDVTSGNMGSCNGGTYAAAYVNSGSICTGAGGTLYTLGGHANSTPAMDCFLTTMGGSPIGTDSSALAFNPSACPGFSPGTVATPSAPAAVMLAVKIQ